VCLIRYPSSKTQLWIYITEAKSLHGFRKLLEKLKDETIIDSSYMKKHHLGFENFFSHNELKI